MAEETTTNTKSSPSMTDRLKFIGIGLLIGALLGGIGAGKVYFDLQGEISAGEAKRLALQNSHDLLRARAALAATVVDLKNENYGDAKNTLAIARKQLDGFDAAGAGFDAAAMDAIKSRLDTVSVAATANTGATIRTLDEIGGAIDRLLFAAE